MTITIVRQVPSTAEALIRHTQDNVTLHITPASNLIQHPGTLYVAHECLYFFSPESDNTGLAIPYQSIIIHAIARESAVGPNIYCQLEGSLPVQRHGGSGAGAGSTTNGHGNASNDKNGTQDQDEDEDDMDEDAVLELSFVPADVSSLDTIYEHLSYCASLHQDEDGDDYDMDGEEGGDYDEEEEEEETPYLDETNTGSAPPSGTVLSSIGERPVVAGVEADGVESMPVIDLENGEWYTGNPETDAKFELSDQGQVNVQQWHQNQKKQADDVSATLTNHGKRLRPEDQDSQGQDQTQDQDEAMTGESSQQQQQQQQEYTEEQAQDARSKMWRVY
ncbi:regulator of volume decrease after cellular swelling-domain-containing protein [Mortierella sp. GBAus27b]|nr:hypothetical protein BGX31_003518 [Mortierella sp. GBA43]KAI8348758.1 regulator of volume decrease after cellular swelling-domain-containing protein [Mortierella sp. GBAus27b]